MGSALRKRSPQGPTVKVKGKFDDDLHFYFENPPSTKSIRVRFFLLETYFRILEVKETGDVVEDELLKIPKFWDISKAAQVDADVIQVFNETNIDEGNQAEEIRKVSRTKHYELVYTRIFSDYCNEFNMAKMIHLTQDVINTIGYSIHMTGNNIKSEDSKSERINFVKNMKKLMNSLYNDICKYSENEEKWLAVAKKSLLIDTYLRVIYAQKLEERHYKNPETKKSVQEINECTIHVLRMINLVTDYQDWESRSDYECRVLHWLLLYFLKEIQDIDTFRLEELETRKEMLDQILRLCNYIFCNEELMNMQQNLEADEKKMPVYDGWKHLGETTRWKKTNKFLAHLKEHLDTNRSWAWIEDV